jgi:hypothetical protein
VIGMPSRGGSDQLVGGKVIQNVPIRPAVPSTGPGAPTTAIERIEMVRRLHTPASTGTDKGDVHD